MSTADNIWENVKTVFDMAEKKTAKAVELSKKKIWEKKLEDKLEELYVTLGRLCYMSEKKGTCDSEKVQKTIVLIDNTKAELKAVREEIKAMRYSRICTECGAGMKKDDDFCPKCGTAFF